MLAFVNTKEEILQNVHAALFHTTKVYREVYGRQPLKMTKKPQGQSRGPMEVAQPSFYV